jgi:hypothetical protein
MLDGVPSECLKPIVRDRLEKSGVIRRIEAKIKNGMCTAIGALRGQEIDESSIEFPVFTQTGVEADALQVVFDYLKKVGLGWTLQCLENESRTAAGKANHNLIYLIHPELKPPTSPVSENLREESDVAGRVSGGRFRDPDLLSPGDYDEEEEEEEDL